MFIDDVCFYAGKYERGILLSIGTLNPVQSSDICCTSLSTFSSIRAITRSNSASSTMKPSEYLLCPFGRKKALNEGYKEYQHTEQNHDLEYIIDEKLHTSADFSACIKTAGVQQIAYQPVQPFHTKNFVLYEVPNLHNPLLYIDKLKSVDLMQGK